ncbi:hypothetical protein [Aureispira anguillae]|uniref:Uncharacterized protein n=1 Tax=Aureispira anguillae TaxID=2864201 RepID=A0A916DWI3_9BACT|nr:hypothetical protein [Aureispira anguillae]BDS14066.1 hypothetical protein AsAng_0048320 [Aureispira anguillae]
MHYFITVVLFFTIISNSQAQTLQEIANGLEIEQIRLITENQDHYLEVIFSGSEQSFFERSFPYPKIQIELEDGTRLKTEITYMLLKTVLVKTKLQQLPKDFNCKVHLNTLHNTEPDLVFSYTSMPVGKNQFEVTNIDLLRQNGQNFLALTIKDHNPKGQIYPYPIFRIESNQKLIAERDFSTTELVELELIPTTLKQLPKDFSCTIYLDSFGDMGSLSYQFFYQKK